MNKPPLIATGKAKATAPKMAEAKAKAASVVKGKDRPEIGGKAIAPTPAQEIPAPSPTELAMIAAALGRKGDESQDFSALAADAFRLWQACDEEIRQNKNRQREVFDYLPILCQEEFPIEMGRFLELMMPQKRRAEREKAYRHFLIDRNRKRDITEVSDIFANHRMGGFGEKAYKCVGTEFIAWLKADLSASRKLAAAKADRGKFTEDGGVYCGKGGRHSDRRHP